MRSAFGMTLTLLLLVPSAAAQGGVPVDRCSRDCDPIAANGSVPKSGSEPVDVFLYAHYEDILNMAPANTQDVSREADVDAGFLVPVIDTNVGPCVSDTCADFHFKNNQFLWYSSPGLVEYLDEGWRTVQNPGLGYDMPILGESMRLYWYMSARPNTGQAPPTTVGVMPGVDVYAHMETGRFAWQGTMIAQSDFDPSPAGRTNVVTAPGTGDVYEFQAILHVKRDLIPADENGFIVFVQPYQVATDPSGGQQVAAQNWQVHSGPRYPPRLIFQTQEPLRSYAKDIAYTRPYLTLTWNVQGVLGWYDRNDTRRNITITGPTEIPRSSIADVSENYVTHIHDRTFRAPNATWRILTDDLRLADGVYHANLSITNLQGTYAVRDAIDFRVEDGRIVVPGAVTFDGNGAPGLPSVAAFGALVALAVWRRRSFFCRDE